MGFANNENEYLGKNIQSKLSNRTWMTVFLSCFFLEPFLGDFTGTYSVGHIL